jgi:hypothetical protein
VGVRRFRKPACLLAAATAIALAAPAQAAGPTEFFGANAAGIYPTSSEFQRAAQGGVRTMRLQFPWQNIERAPGFFDWRQFDPIVADAARAGVKLLPVLYGTPPWALPPATSSVTYTATDPPIYTPQSRAAWSSFITAAAQRYGSNGDFWALHPELPNTPIHNWQVWNEVNLASYWGGRPNARRYAGLLRLTRTALRAADPSSRVILAGLLPYQSTAPGSVSGANYLKRLYRVKGVRKLFDVVAIHPYAYQPREVVRLLRAMRKVLNSVGARRTPIWATEFGWTTGGVDFGASPFRSTPDRQARRVGKTYRLMRREKRSLRLRRAMYFSFADSRSAGAGSWQTHMGLLNVDGTPKPAWYAYTRLSGGSP